MIFLYKFLTFVLYPFLVTLIYFRKFLNKEDSERFKEKIFTNYFNITRKKNTKLIWFHAASIGEFKSILPLIEELKKDNTNFEFLVTTITLTSANLAKEKLKGYENIHHRFLPLDVTFLMRKFFLMWRPSVVFLVDSEIWPNLIFEAKNKKIPIALINARITQKTFKKWEIFKNTARKIFGNFNLFLASNLETVSFLNRLKVKNVFYTGNLKLIKSDIKTNLENQNSKLLKELNFWCGVSTHNGEENFCLQTHLELKKTNEKIITIIAPRHISRIDQIIKLCREKNLSYQVLDKEDLLNKNKEIILINSFGILPYFLKYSKSVFIGKSTIKKLESDSGQNPIEAAQLGCFIYHGEYIYNFKEIYEILEKNEISKKINNFNELSKNILIDFNKPSKNINQFSDLMKSLSEKTLSSYKHYINNLLVNENI